MNVGSGFSIFLNTILGGEPGEPLSCRNWELKRQAKRHWVKLIDKLFMSDIHCLESWVRWKVKPKEFRQTELEKRLNEYYKYDGMFD